MDQVRITSERIVVAGKVSGGKGVARVLVTLNGAEVFTQEEGWSANNEVILNFRSRCAGEERPPRHSRRFGGVYRAGRPDALL
jgi:hypothetical protein